MISLPTEQELKELLDFKAPQALTAYIAFSNPGGGQNQNRIEFKNILRDAELALVAAKAKPGHIEATLKPMRDMLDSHEFTTPKNYDMAFFAHPTLFRMFKLPEGSVNTEVVVKNRFSIRQLEDVIADNQPYYVLALSRKATKLYKGDRYGLEPVTVKGVPQDVESALNIDEYRHSQQHHSIVAESRGSGSTNIHDQSEVKNTDKQMVYEFFRLVDNHIKPILTASKLPLVIGGVENLVALYGKANSYKGVVRKHVFGNLDRSTIGEIHSKAWAALQTQSAS